MRFGGKDTAKQKVRTETFIRPMATILECTNSMAHKEHMK